MSAKKIDGKAVAAKVRADVGEAVKALPSQPTLAVRQVRFMCARKFA